MANCNHTLQLHRGSVRPQKANDTFTLEIVPNLVNGCTKVVRVNGKALKPNQSEGSIEYSGDGFTQVTFKVLKDEFDAKITFEIECENPVCRHTTNSYDVNHREPVNKAAQMTIMTVSVVGCAVLGGVTGSTLGPVGTVVGTALGLALGTVVGMLLGKLLG